MKKALISIIAVASLLIFSFSSIVSSTDYVKNYQSSHSSTTYDYLYEYIDNVKTSASSDGWWDSANGRWIYKITWSGNASGWTSYEIWETLEHQWKYCGEMQEGALYFTEIMNDSILDDYISSSFEHMNSHVNSDGTVDGLSSASDYEYGIFLSCLGMGFVHFSGVNDTCANACLDSLNKTFPYVTGTFSSNGYSTDYSQLLRGFVGAYKAYNLSGNNTGKTASLSRITELASSFISHQDGDGEWDTGSDNWQTKMKRCIAMTIAYEVTYNSTYLTTTADCLDWGIANRMQSNGGFKWNAASNEYYECHQVWFMNPAKMVFNYLGESYNYTADITKAWQFLTDNNYCDFDWYVHNYIYHGTFFAYREQNTEGSFQIDNWKGSYEVGAAIWGLALNYNLGNYSSGSEESGIIQFNSINGQENNSVLQDNNRIFKWNIVSGATNYSLRISNFSDFHSEIFLQLDNISLAEWGAAYYSEANGNVTFILPDQYNITAYGYHYYQVRAYTT